MTDRHLRDEIEQLSTELREARKQLDFSRSVSAGAEQLRALTARWAAAKLQHETLKHQVPATEALLADRRAEAETLKDELSNLRKQIAGLDPLPNPFDFTLPEGSDSPGCLPVLVLSLAALGWSSVAWWLA